MDFIRKSPRHSPHPPRDWYWQEDSACQSAPENDKQAFVNGYPTVDVAKDVIKRYCRTCPVRANCFNWAYDEKPFVGIAGGAMFSAPSTMTGRGASRNIRRMTDPKE